MPGWAAVGGMVLPLRPRLFEGRLGELRRFGRAGRGSSRCFTGQLFEPAGRERNDPPTAGTLLLLDVPVDGPEVEVKLPRVRLAGRPHFLNDAVDLHWLSPRAVLPACRLPAGRNLSCGRTAQGESQWR